MSGTPREEQNCYIPAVNNLSEGLLKIYEPSLTNLQIQLAEMQSKQNKLTSQIHEENISLAKVQYSTEIQDTFKKMSLYHNKLLGIKRDMKQIHERSMKLKKRAIKIQQFREKEMLAKEKIEQELKREQELIGPGPSSSESS
ncbi:unnamed protein product [Phaedon cochleariae]|uniref:Biogenesis of lysosome-related organelles complex 1 subunit 6 n=1 Tax=Phaedon cochleariae TaxID=80249 RepID=A0A9P0DSB5_PHACE|nr:unnamed protein product [Phaedon cochleariae]